MLAIGKPLGRKVQVNLRFFTFGIIRFRTDRKCTFYLPQHVEFWTTKRGRNSCYFFTLGDRN